MTQFYLNANKLILKINKSYRSIDLLYQILLKIQIKFMSWTEMKISNQIKMIKMV